MPDALERTFGGATRALIAALGFILLTVGIGMMTDRAGAQFQFGLFLSIFGVTCWFLWFIWESAKKILTAEALKTIDDFARNANTWRAMFFLMFLAIIMSPFIEQHRWPFSYPMDPSAVEETNKIRANYNDLEGRFGPANELATRWKFVHELRTFADESKCTFYLNPTSKAERVAQTFWKELLQDAGWSGNVTGGAQEGTMPPGITIRVVEETGSTHTRGAAFQKALSDVYPSPAAKLIVSQTNCGQCVQIDMDY